MSEEELGGLSSARAAVTVAAATRTAQERESKSKLIKIVGVLFVYIFIILDWATTLFGIGIGAVETNPNAYRYGMGVAMVRELVIISVLVGGVLLVDKFIRRLNPSLSSSLWYPFVIGWGLISLAPCFVVVSNINIILNLGG